MCGGTAGGHWAFLGGSETRRSRREGGGVMLNMEMKLA